MLASFESPAEIPESDGGASSLRDVGARRPLATNLIQWIARLCEYLGLSRTLNSSSLAALMTLRMPHPSGPLRHRRIANGVCMQVSHLAEVWDPTGLRSTRRRSAPDSCNAFVSASAVDRAER